MWPRTDDEVGRWCKHRPAANALDQPVVLKRTPWYEALVVGVRRENENDYLLSTRIQKDIDSFPPVQNVVRNDSANIMAMSPRDINSSTQK